MKLGLTKIIMMIAIVVSPGWLFAQELASESGDQAESAGFDPNDPNLGEDGRYREVVRTCLAQSPQGSDVRGCVREFAPLGRDVDLAQIDIDRAVSGVLNSSGGHSFAESVIEPYSNSDTTIPAAASEATYVK